jgi:hypothetical protein
MTSCRCRNDSNRGPAGPDVHEMRMGLTQPMREASIVPPRNEWLKGAGNLRHGSRLDPNDRGNARFALERGVRARSHHRAPRLVGKSDPMPGVKAAAPKHGSVNPLTWHARLRVGMLEFGHPSTDKAAMLGAPVVVADRWVPSRKPCPTFRPRRVVRRVAASSTIRIATLAINSKNVAAHLCGDTAAFAAVSVVESKALTSAVRLP